MAAQADIRRWFMKKPDHKAKKDGAEKEDSETKLASEGAEGASDAKYKKESKFFTGGVPGGKGTTPTGDKSKLKLDKKSSNGGKRKSDEGLASPVLQDKTTSKKPRMVIPADDVLAETKEAASSKAKPKSLSDVDSTQEKNGNDAPLKTPSRVRGRGKVADLEKDDEEAVPSPVAGRGKGKTTKTPTMSSTPQKPPQTPTSVGKGRGKAADEADVEKKVAAGRGGGRGGGGGWASWNAPRATPPHKGEKEVPQGAEDALAGLTFVISGTLDSLEREEAEILIKSHGGRVTGSVSKKTSFLLADEDVGGAKSKKAKENGVKFLSEDGLFEMICKTKPKSTPVKQIEPKRTPIKTPGDSTGRGVSSGVRGGLSVSNSASGSLSVGMSLKQDDCKKMPLPLRPGKAGQDNQSWPNKYQPQTTADIIGNQTIVKQLKDWLQHWEGSFLQSGGKGVKGKKRGGGSSSNVEKKAVLLCGTPGIGKTTTARLVCKELGYETLEVNASDSRGKADSSVRKGMGGSTANTIKEMVDNESINFGVRKSQTKKSALIMDEVDGMSGGDRGGVADLIASIKSSRVPIICICNDRYSQKLKSLTNYCLLLSYRKPTKQQMAKRLLHVAKAEGIQVDEVTLEDIAERSNGDMRTSLNQLQYMSLRTQALKFADVHSRLLASAKDQDISPFSAADKLLGFEGGRLRMDERVDLHMSDPDLVPLLVQENYLNFFPSEAGRDQSGLLLMERVASAATSLAEGDIVNKQIRKHQQWQHSQTAAFLSSIIPSALMHGQRKNFEGERNFNRFSAWLGKNSSYGKRVRLLEDIHIHLLASRVCEPTRESIRMEYVPLLALQLSHPLRQLPKDAAVEQVVGLMDEYSLTQEDYEAVMEVSKFQGHPDPLEGVQPAVKTALTKFYKSRMQNRCVRSADLLPPVALPGQRKGPKKPARLKLTVQNASEGNLNDDDGDAGEEGEEEVEEEEEMEEDGSSKLESLLTAKGSVEVTVDFANQKKGAAGRGGPENSKASESKTPRKNKQDAKAGASTAKRRK